MSAIYRAEVYLPAGLPQLSRLQVSTASSSGPWTAVDLPSAAPLVGGAFTGALAAWAAAAATAVPTRAFSFTWSDTTGLVTLSATGGDAWVQLTDSQADLLGFSVLTLDLAAGATSDEVPLGAAVLLGVSASVAKPKARAELFEFRGGRIASYHGQRSTWHQIEAAVPETIIDRLEDGPLLRTGLHLLTLGDPAAAYDAAAGVWNGQLAVTPVAGSLRIERVEGQEAEAVLTFDAVAGR